MKLKQLAVLLSPSFLSGSLCVSSSIIVLLGATWSYSVGTGAVYNFLFGPGSSAELISSSRTSISVFFNTVFGNSILNKTLYFGFWMMVGLIVYVIIMGLIHGTSTAVRDVEEVTYTNVKKHDKYKTFGLRIGIHLLVAVAWALYCVFFVKIFFPFSILAARVGFVQLPHITGWLYSPLSFVILTLSLHIHVIFIRLVVLRLRLYESN